MVFADCARREALVAAGISRAAAVVITFAGAAAAMRVLANIHALNPTVPVIVRAREERDIEKLTAAGAPQGGAGGVEAGGGFEGAKGGGVVQAKDKKTGVPLWGGGGCVL